MATVLTTPPTTVPPTTVPPVDAGTAPALAVAPRPSVAPFVAALLGAVAAVGATEWIVTALQLHMSL